MILPTKYLQEHETLLGVGALLLKELNSSSKSLSDLWEKSKDNNDIGNYERFILALDMLFLFGLIEMRDNKLLRIHNDS